MSTSDRLVDILRLFNAEKPAWTIAEAAQAMRMSASTAYRYFSSLRRGGFIEKSVGGEFVLGPAFIEIDRQIQTTDPLLRAAGPIVTNLVRDLPDTATVMLCRVFRDRTISISQVVGSHPEAPAGYERGSELPRFRGATARVMLAYADPRRLRRLYATNTPAIADAGLGDTWGAFRSGLAEIRRAGHVISRGEVRPGRVSVAVPVLAASGEIEGSLTIVMFENLVDPALLRRLVILADMSAKEIRSATIPIIDNS